MEYTAFNHAAWNPRHSIGMHWASRHGLHCIPSHCMESTAFNRDVWAMLYKIHCIQSRCIWPHCMDSTAHNCDPLHHNEWNTLHSMKLHGIDCNPSGSFGPCGIKSIAFNHAAWNPLHSIGMHFTRLHGLHCIQAQCMESTAFNDAALDPLH